MVELRLEDLETTTLQDRRDNLLKEINDLAERKDITDSEYWAVYHQLNRDITAIEQELRNRGL